MREKCFAAVLWLATYASADMRPRPPEFGPAINGLATRLITDRARYEERENIWLYLDVFNAGDQPIKVALGAVSSIEPMLRLTLESGRPLEPRQRPDPSRVGVATLWPGKQKTAVVLYMSGNDYAMYAPLKPGRYKANWPSQGTRTVKGARFPPESRAVRFEVVARKEQDSGAGQRKTKEPWGVTSGGLQTRMSAPGRKFALGSPIPMTLELRYLGKKAIRYHQPDVAVEGRLDVRDGRGQKVPFLCGSVQTANPTRALRPGETAMLGTFDLAEYYLLVKPGKYTIQYRGNVAATSLLPEPFKSKASGSKPVALPSLGLVGQVNPRFANSPGASSWPEPLPASNTFRFEVLPGSLADPLVRALAVLVAKCPREWEMVSWQPVSYLEQPGSQWSRVHCRRYTFEHKDQFAHGLKPRRILPLSLWIATERAFEEPWDVSGEGLTARSEYCGKCPFGHVYLRRPNPGAVARWPTFKADLLRWLHVKRS